MTEFGRREWVIPGGRIPFHSTGREPEFTSRDELAVLNAGQSDANLAITLFYPDREPVGPYKLVVKARRTRRVRINDLIFPEAVPLEVDYAALIEADNPVIVQFTRVDTGHAETSWAGGIAFPSRG
jgi:hypothetical protein